MIRGFVFFVAILIASSGVSLRAQEFVVELSPEQRQLRLDELNAEVADRLVVELMTDEEQERLDDLYAERESLSERVLAVEEGLRYQEQLRRRYQTALRIWYDIEELDISEFEVEIIQDLRESALRSIDVIYDPNVKKRWKAILETILEARDVSELQENLKELRRLKGVAEGEIERFQLRLNDVVSKTAELRLELEEAQRREKLISNEIDLLEPTLFERLLLVEGITQRLEQQCREYSSPGNAVSTYSQPGTWQQRCKRDLLSQRCEPVSCGGGARQWSYIPMENFCTATETVTCFGQPANRACTCKLDAVNAGAEVPLSLARTVCLQTAPETPTCRSTSPYR